MKISKEEIIDELVREFGEEYRDEIEYTINFGNWIWSKYSRSRDGGSFIVFGRKYNFIVSIDVAMKLAKKRVLDMEYIDDETLSYYVVRFLDKDVKEDVIETVLDRLVRDWKEGQYYNILKGKKSDKEIDTLKKQINDEAVEYEEQTREKLIKEFDKSLSGFYNTYEGYLMGKYTLKDLLDYCEIDFDTLANEELDEYWKGWFNLAKYDFSNKYKTTVRFDKITKRGIIIFGSEKFL